MPTIVICASVAFYEHVNKLAEQLEKAGFSVVVPFTARKMRESGNYEVANVKTWFDNEADFIVKADLMKGHFAEIAAGDAVLVVNDEKHGVAGYIGPNVLMEMGLAFYLGKPIYVLEPVTRDVPVYEEVMGMLPIILNGDLDAIGQSASGAGLQGELAA